MEEKIYIVTSGEYSDYHICAVFSTREKAEEYVQIHGTDYGIEEYDLDEEIKREVKLWRVAVAIKNNEIIIIEPCPTEYRVEEMTDTCYINADWYGEPIMYFYVQSETMDRAIKIASERFAAVKANEYIWLRLTRPYNVDKYGINCYERFNVKTNEFIKE